MPDIQLVLVLLHSQPKCSQKQMLCQWNIQVVEEFGSSGCSMGPGLFLYITTWKVRMINSENVHYRL